MATIAVNITAINTCKSDLADNLTTMGVTSANTEALSALVGKVLDIPSGSTITGSTDVTGIAGENLTAGDMVERKYVSALGSTITGLTIPTIGVTGRRSEYTRDNVYLATSSFSSPYVLIYKRDGDTHTLLTGLPSLASAVYDVSWSPDRIYLAIAYNTSPFIQVWKRTGDSFASLTVPTLTNALTSVSFSNNGTYVAGTCVTTPFVYVLKRTGDSFASITVPSFSYRCNHCAWSPDDTYLAIAQQVASSASLIVLKRSTDTFTACTVYNSPSYYGTYVEFHPNGDYLYFSCQGGNNFYAFKRSGDLFALIDINLTGSVSGNGTGAACHIGGAFIIALGASSPYAYLYEIGGDKLTNKTFTSSVASQPNGVCFSRDGKYIVITETSSPYIRLYKSDSILTVKKIGTSDYPIRYDLGFVESSVTSGNSATMKSIIKTTLNYPT